MLSNMLRFELQRILSDKKTLILLAFLFSLITILHISFFFISADADLSGLLKSSPFWKESLTEEVINREENSPYFVGIMKIIPMVYILLTSVLPIILGIHSIVQEKEQGTLESLFFLPFSHKKILFSKMCSFLVPALILSAFNLVIQVVLSIVFSFHTEIIYFWCFVGLVFLPVWLLFLSTIMLFLSGGAENSKDANQKSLLIAFIVYMLIQGSYLVGIDIMTLTILAWAICVSIILTISIWFLMFRNSHFIEFLVYGIKKQSSP